MKIVYVHHGSVPGGAPTSLRNLLRELRRTTEHQLKVLCVFPSMIPFFSAIEGVEVEPYVRCPTTSGRGFLGWSGLLSRGMLGSIARDLVQLQQTVRIEQDRLRIERADVVHLNSGILWSTALACHLSSIPLVWHLREAPPVSPYAPNLMLYAAFMRRLADRLVCIGPLEYEKIGGADHDHVVQIRNSLDPAFFEREPPSAVEARRGLGLPEDKHIYLSLGGLSYRKGTVELIESTGHLSADHLCVIGGTFRRRRPPFDARIHRALEREDWLRRWGLKSYLSEHYAERVELSLRRADPSRLRIPGEIDDVRPWIAASDVLVFADTTSHSGRPVFEAWATRRPVVAFDTPAMRHEIDHGVDGLLVSPSTPEALAEAIASLRRDPARARRMAEAGYVKALERFEPRRNAAAVLELYAEIRAQRRGS